MKTIEEQFQKLGVVPVVVLEDKKDAIPLAKALSEGGLPCAEVTFRTDAAADGLRALGLVGGVERALGLADVGAQSLLFFDDGHGISLRSDKISSPLW